MTFMSAMLRRDAEGSCCARARALSGSLWARRSMTAWRAWSRFGPGGSACACFHASSGVAVGHQRVDAVDQRAVGRRLAAPGRRGRRALGVDLDPASGQDGQRGVTVRVGLRHRIDRVDGLRDLVGRKARGVGRHAFHQLVGIARLHHRGEVDRARRQRRGGNDGRPGGQLGLRRGRRRRWRRREPQRGTEVAARRETHAQRQQARRDDQPQPHRSCRRASQNTGPSKAENFMTVTPVAVAHRATEVIGRTFPLR